MCYRALTIGTQSRALTNGNKKKRNSLSEISLCNYISLLALLSVQRVVVKVFGSICFLQIPFTRASWWINRL